MRSPGEQLASLVATPHGQLHVPGTGTVLDMSKLTAGPPIRDWDSLVIEPGDDLQTIRAKGRDWYITPVDPVTHIPYPILQHEHLPVDDPRRASEHHGRHPGANFDVQDSLLPDDPSPLARKAERNAWLQMVKNTDHNVIDPLTGKPTYHDYVFGTIPLKTEKEIFGFVIPAIAGILPEFALDMRSGQPRVVLPTPEQIALMQTVIKPRPASWKKIEAIRWRSRYAYAKIENPNVDLEIYAENTVQRYLDKNNARHGFAYQYLSYNYPVVREFLRDYVFRQDIDLGDSLVDEFLEATEPGHKRMIGEKLLKEAVDTATISISGIYEQAKRSGRVHPARARSARGIVWDTIRQPRTRDRDDLTARFAESLQRQRAMAA